MRHILANLLFVILADGENSYDERHKREAGVYAPKVVDIGDPRARGMPLSN